MKLLLSSRTKYQAGHLVRMCAYTVVVTSLLLIYTFKSLFRTSVLAARSLTHSIVHSSASWIGVRACVRACVCLQVDRLHGFLLLGHHLFMAHNLCNLRKKKKLFFFLRDDDLLLFHINVDNLLLLFEEGERKLFLDGRKRYD